MQLTVFWLVSVSFLLMSIDSVITLYDHNGSLIVIWSSSRTTLLWSDNGQLPRMHQTKW